MRLRDFKDYINKSNEFAAAYGKTPASRGEYDAVNVYTRPGYAGKYGFFTKYPKSEIKELSFASTSEVLTYLKLVLLFRPS